MPSPLPDNALDFMNWPWSQIEPYFLAMQEQALEEDNVDEWLANWCRLDELIFETEQRLVVATTVDTVDKDAKRRYEAFLDYVYPQTQAAAQELKTKLLESGLKPKGFEIALRNMRAEAELYRESNLPLLTQELKLSTEYDRIIGAQTVTWEGLEITLEELHAINWDPNREKRERAWRLGAGRQLADRGAINDLWMRFIQLRGQIASNAELADFRAYRWKKLLRFDYEPLDCVRFQEAIEQVAVPAATRLYERRRRKLGLENLRPWDKYVDPTGLPPLTPFEQTEELEAGVSSIFQHVDPQLADYYEIMRREGLLDLDNRKNKAPGGYCTDFPVARRPFIFMNAVGLHEDVLTLLHEGGHAFHLFESLHLPYFQQRQVGLEIAEVASMSMELLAAPYLTADQGGFYTTEEAARARIESLEVAVLFWPYMAVVDAFQHWVYENHRAASNPDNCDARWGELWERFMPGEDWSGLEEEMFTGWQRKGHIHQDPFYYVEYGLAQLGAFQVWRNSLSDQAGALSAYREALALGGTKPIPELFAAAGAKFAFDAETLAGAVELAEKTIEELESLIDV